MKKPYVMVVSLLLQIGGLAVLTLIPLLYPQVLPMAQIRGVLAAPSPPRAVPPHVQLVKVPPGVVARLFKSTALIAPRAIPPQINQVQEVAAAPDISLGGGVPGGSETGNSGLLDAIPETVPPPVAAPQKRPAAGPLRVGGAVSQSNLIHSVQPAYPALAKSARVQGTVEFTAVISKQGNIENLQLVKGHPLLVNAAREAILQWKYKPTMLNGEPVEVITNIIVNFALSQ